MTAEKADDESTEIGGTLNATISYHYVVGVGLASPGHALAKSAKYAESTHAPYALISPFA